MTLEDLKSITKRPIKGDNNHKSVEKKKKSYELEKNRSDRDRDRNIELDHLKYRNDYVMDLECFIRELLGIKIMYNGYKNEGDKTFIFITVNYEERGINYKILYHSNTILTRSNKL